MVLSDRESQYLGNTCRDDGEQRGLLAGSHFRNKIKCSWGGGRPLILHTCLGLGAVNNQQPFSSPSLQLQKSFTVCEGRDANDSRSQGHFSKLICTPKCQADLLSWGSHCGDISSNSFVDAPSTVCSVTFQLTFYTRPITSF